MSLRSQKVTFMFILTLTYVLNLFVLVFLIIGVNYQIFVQRHLWSDSVKFRRGWGAKDYRGGVNSAPFQQKSETAPAISVLPLWQKDKKG